MRKKLFILVLTGFIINSISAQLNISVDKSCMTRNSILLSQTLIKTLGKEYISTLLENNIRILLFFNVDSLGNTTLVKSKISNFKSNGFQDTNSVNIEKLKSNLDLNLKIQKSYFNICYERFPNLSDSASIKIISSDLFKDKENILINVAFPGELMMYYELEKEKLMKEGKSITKYEYLENKIKNSH